MLALSTSCLSTLFDNGEALIQKVLQFDIAAVELEYRITDAMHRQMRAPLKRSGLQVVSVHNYYPLPPTVPRAMANGDLFLLSHPDKEERMRAIEWTSRTIETANDLEAKAVVLHCGSVGNDIDIGKLYDFLEKDMIESDEVQEFIQEIRARREEKKPGYIESLLFSLDRLLRVADKMNVFLGMENRYFFHEIPGADDFELIFREFEGSPLRYWHDAGHAQVNELLGLVKQEDLLKTHADRLLGVHLHDARKRDDHLPPGAGVVDFQMIKSYLKEDTIRVVELKVGLSDAEIAEGIAYLRSLGID